jgi:phage tail sheath gpL-like
MINTGVSAQLRRPQTFHAFTYQYAVRSLVALPLRIAMVGTMSTAKTATAATVYEIADAGQSDTLFGVSSELALMCRKAFETGAKLQKGPRLYAVGAADPAGTANVQTITCVGTATADGVILVTVAGRQVSVGVRTGDVQDTIATAISNALKTIQATLPTTVSVATNVVTLTHAVTGINGTDVIVTVDQQVAGNVPTVATTVPGVGVVDITAALDALAPLPFDGIAIGNHAAADVTDINTDIASRWSYSEKRWRYYFIGERGSIGTATALAAAANHQAVVIASMEGCLSTCGEMATALCFATFSRERPNANYDGLKIPLFPPAAATVYTPTEVETAIAAGLTPLTAEIDPFTRTVTAGVAKIERMITTKTTISSAPFEVLRDLAVSRVGVYAAQQFDVAFITRFGAEANPDGTLASDDTIDQIKDMIEGILRLMQAGQIIRNVDDDLARLVVERDDVAIGRFNIDVAYTVVVGLHQLAFVHRVQV